MQSKINDYTSPDLSGIVNGLTNDATDVTAIFTSSNQVNDTLDKLSHNTQKDVTTTASITQNVETNIMVSSAGGAYAITLPAGSGQYKPIYLYKYTSDYNKVTISCAGADKIDNPFSPQAVPTATSFLMYLPGEYYMIYWDGTYWRVACLSIPRNNLRLHAKVSNTYATSAGFDITRFDYEIADPSSNFDTGTYKFTVPIDGLYDISAVVSLESATSGNNGINLYVNGVLVEQGSYQVTANFYSPTMTLDGYPLSSGDLVDIRTYTEYSRTVTASTSDRSTFMISLHSRT